jgi:hypothetical protein
MALKLNLTLTEKFGLTEEEIVITEKYLKRNKTRGVVPLTETMKLYELFMIGYSFSDIHNQYPQYPIAQITLTAALRGWCHDRDRMMGSLKDRIQARVVKSIIEQVDFLTTMLSVTDAQHMTAMRNYILDPINNPMPKMAIESIKEYKDVADTLGKLVAGISHNASSSAKKSPMMEQLSAPTKRLKIEEPKKKVFNIQELAEANED